MSEKYASAILHWRQYAGSADTWSSAAVSTILFGCERWIEKNGPNADQVTRERVVTIKDELEAWLAERGAEARPSAT
jgi:hypothetical protein